MVSQSCLNIDLLQQRTEGRTALVGLQHLIHCTNSTTATVSALYIQRVINLKLNAHQKQQHF